MNNALTKKNIPYFLIFISFIMLFFRSRYSFCWSDESFYSAITSRFFKGDSLFYDEWFPTQLSSLLLLPFYSFFFKVVGSTDGIFLFFRILYVFLELISSIISYKIISKYHGTFSGCIVALLVQWYTHLNIATLSYYTMSTHFFVLTLLIIYDCYMQKTEIRNINEISRLLPTKLIIAGLLFALCVLCLPTMCVAYFLVVFVGFCTVFISLILKNNIVIQNFAKKLDFVNTFKWTLAGIVVPAIIFLIYMFTHISIQNFLNSLVYVLSDDEHELSKIYPIKKMYLSINESYGSVAKLAYIFIAVSFLLFLCAIVSKTIENDTVKQKIQNLIHIAKLAFFAIDILLFVLYFIKSFGHTGYIFTAIMLFSLPLFLLTDNKNYYMFFIFFIGGLVFSLVYSYSSNGMLYLLSMGHFVSSIGGIVFILDFVKEIDNRHFVKTAQIFVYAIIMVCVIQTCVLRITNIYRDDQLKNLTNKISVGPAKGLYTSEEHFNMYMDVYDVINEYCMSTSGYSNNRNILISKLLPFGYIISDLNVSAPTVWRNSMDSERLEQYYEIHPDKYPDIILVLDDYYGSYETCGDVEADYIPNENASNGYIYNYIRENSFKRIDTVCGSVYVKE